MRILTENRGRFLRGLLIIGIVLVVLFAGFALAEAFSPALPVSAEEVTEQPATEETAEAEEEQDATGSKAIAAGIAIGLAAGAAAIGMGIAVARSSEAISRQPEAEGKIRSSMMIGLVFVETAIIYAFVVAILIVFAL